MMTKLEIKYNFLSNRQPQFEALLCLLGSLTKGVTELDFSNVHLDRLHIDELVQVFTAIPDHIQVISLRSNHLAEKLSILFPHLPVSLVKLDLSHNQLIRLRQVDYSYLLLNLPLQVKSLVLDYQDISQVYPFFPEHLQELSLLRCLDFISRFELREKLNQKLPRNISRVYLNDTLWIFASGFSDLASFIRPDSDTLIVSMQDLEFSGLKHGLNTLPSHIKNLYLDFSEFDYFHFRQLSSFYKMDEFLKFSPHLEQIVCNGKFVAQRNALASFNFYDLSKDEKLSSHSALPELSLFAEKDALTSDFFGFFAELEEEEDMTLTTL